MSYRTEIPFTLSKFIITTEYGIPLSVMDKIVKHHIGAVLDWRLKTDIPIWVSQRSCYRPFEYELAKGRSGDSQHTFKDDGLGAADWTTGTRSNMLSLFKWVASKDCPYTRVCFYPDQWFIHCDYKIANGKQLYLNDNGWKLSDYETISSQISKH